MIKTKYKTKDNILPGHTMKTHENTIAAKAEASAAANAELMEYLSPGQLCQMLGVSRRTLINWERKGLVVPTIHVGHVVRYELDRVLASLKASHPHAGAAAAAPAPTAPAALDRAA